MFSYDEEELPDYKDPAIVKELIHEIINFNRNYKRKPKKFRKLGAPNLDMLDSIDPRTQPPIPDHPSSNFLAHNNSDEEEDH